MMASNFQQLERKKNYYGSFLPNETINFVLN